MHADLVLSSQRTAEWRHSGRYLLVAITLHAVVLFTPYPFAVSQIDIPISGTIQVTLADQPAVPLPVATPPAPAPSVKPSRQPVRPTASPRQIIAVAAESAAGPANFSVPVPVVSENAPIAAGPSPPAPVAVTAARFNAAYLNNPEPKYPPLSRRLGEEGKVLLKVRIMPDGHPASVDLEKSSSFERLDEAAKQAVARWRFVPAKRGDEPIEASVIVPIVFRLDS